MKKVARGKDRTDVENITGPEKSKKTQGVSNSKKDRTTDHLGNERVKKGNK